MGFLLRALAQTAKDTNWPEMFGMKNISIYLKKYAMDTTEFGMEFGAITVILLQGIKVTVQKKI